MRDTLALPATPTRRDCTPLIISSACQETGGNFTPQFEVKLGLCVRTSIQIPSNSAVRDQLDGIKTHARTVGEATAAVAIGASFEALPICYGHEGLASRQIFGPVPRGQPRHATPDRNRSQPGLGRPGPARR